MLTNSVHQSAYKSYAAMTKKASATVSGYTPPSGDVIVNAIFEKMAIDRMVDEKEKTVELSLTGYGDQNDGSAKHSAKTRAEMYRATLEGELKTKIAQMTRQEQTAREDMYQMSVPLMGRQGSYLNLYL